MGVMAHRGDARPQTAQPGLVRYRDDRQLFRNRFANWELPARQEAVNEALALL
jgi:hypothetical protein